MSIFNRKIQKKHVEQFALSIAKLLEPEMPELLKVITLSEVHGISFTQQPKGIYIAIKYDSESYKISNSKHKNCFNLTGISVFHRKEKRYISIPLYYQSDSLTKITVDQPEYFHKTFDLTKIQKTTIELEHLSMENPDQKTVENILQSLTPKQLELLELTDSFEIEFDGKLFYTIINMGDGDYVVVDTQGKVYRLIHDHEKPIKLIAEKPVDFFEIYDGQKSKLNQILFD